MAPAKFFTGREDIPRYFLNGSRDCRFAYVVVGQDAENQLANQLSNYTYDDFDDNGILTENEFSEEEYSNEASGIEDEIENMLQDDTDIEKHPDKTD